MSDPGQRYLASLPPIRAHLLAGALLFVQAAGVLPGVRRIALLGSITTEKASPKDIDLLVTVADDADLTQLAALGRKLMGHAQSRNSGADVFLASPRDSYRAGSATGRSASLGCVCAVTRSTAGAGPTSTMT